MLHYGRISWNIPGQHWYAEIHSLFAAKIKTNNLKKNNTQTQNSLKYKTETEFNKLSKHCV